ELRRRSVIRGSPSSSPRFHSPPTTEKIQSAVDARGSCDLRVFTRFFLMVQGRNSVVLPEANGPLVSWPPSIM
ncbi:unnamed protein product, partial [Acanthoscelides obtectus]